MLQYIVAYCELNFTYEWKVHYLSKRGMRIAKEVASAGARTVGGVISLVLKILGTIILAGVTTLLVFACIFSIYCKTTFSTGVDVEYEEFALNLSSVIYAKNSDTGEWEELVTLDSTEYRMWTDYETIPKHVEHAVVAIEDKRFYEHQGVDWYRTSGAFVNMFIGMKNTFGGSTITQQLIKNTTGNDEGTVQRKLLEIFQALEFEKKYEKEQIVEWYLNEVYFGHGCYGIGAAARFYFGKEVSELTIAEAACIIGITNNPSLYSPFISPEGNKDRQENILFEMYDQGYITESQYEAAKNEVLVFDEGDEEDSDDVYSWFEEAVRDDVIEDIAEIKHVSLETAELMLLTGGYKIYATVDPRIQAIVEEVYSDPDNLSGVSGSSQQIQSAIVVIDPYTGDIVGMAGGLGEKTVNLGWNRATDSERQPGSSIKPIASYAPAIEYGLVTPSTYIEDGKDVKLNGTSWMPRNFDWDYDGVITVQEGLMKSINTVAAQLVDMLGVSRSFEFLRVNAGISTLTIEDMDYSALAVGGMYYGVTVRDMASAFTMFVNKGIRSAGRTYSAIYDNDDNLVYENKTEQVVAISEKTAYWMTRMLELAGVYGTSYVSALDNMPSAGKTGTTSSTYDRWFVGYTPYYVAAVWTGYDNPTTMYCSGNPSASMWKKVMGPIHEGLEYKDFYVPESTWLSPVKGVTPIDIYIRGVDEEGNVLYEEQGYDEKSTVEGREIQVSAKDVEGYTLIGDKEITYTVVESDDGRNYVEFVYKNNNPEPEPEPEPGTEPEQGNPDGGGGGGLGIFEVFN